MRNSDRGIAKLADRFTARERAVLVLRARKEGRDEDSSWRWWVPEGQAWEFNRLIGLMNGVNERLMPLFLVLALEADKLALRLNVLGVLALWYVQAENSRWLLGHECPEAKLAADRLAHAPRLPVMHLGADLQKVVDEATECVEPSKLDELAVVHKERLREDLQEHLRCLAASTLRAPFSKFLVLAVVFGPASRAVSASFPGRRQRTRPGIVGSLRGDNG